MARAQLEDVVFNQSGHPLGGIKLQIAVHSKWSRNIYVTEVGWPLSPGTGDSQGWTEAGQADNVKKFCVWMKEAGQSYVKSVQIFADFDESSERKYGLIEGNALNNRARTGWGELGKYSKELAGF